MNFLKPTNANDSIIALRRGDRRLSSLSFPPIFVVFVVAVYAAVGTTSAFTPGPITRRHGQRGSAGLGNSAANEQDGSIQAVEEICRKLERQQQQIDNILSIVLQQQQQQIQNQGNSAVTSDGIQQPASNTWSPNSLQPVQLAPIKAMLFIDGTWLFYSLFQRQRRGCAIIREFGPLWPITHSVHWQALIHIISRSLMEQQQMYASPSFPVQQPGQQSGGPQARAVEIVRASVFTSYKADTSTASQRYIMFEELKAAGFDVHMMETVGKSEKCVDIQLAVEMLHYATVPRAYDVAVLLTGDKDFMPAMMRTRQKGRQVALVSMRTGCNQALINTPMLKDFDVIWLDDHVHELIVPKLASDLIKEPPSMSTYTVSKVLMDFILLSSEDCISSRLVGRLLKFIHIGSTNILDELKSCYGGIYMFLVSQANKIFSISFEEEDEDDEDEDMRWYSIGLKPDAHNFLLEERKRASFSDSEREFFDTYSQQMIIDLMSALGMEVNGDVITNSEKSGSIEAWEELLDELPGYTLPQLREKCREMELPTSGLKAVVFDRVQMAIQKEMEQAKSADTYRIAKMTRQPDRSGQTKGKRIPDTSSRYLIELLKEYIHASGGKASSRNVGRYLSANRVSTESLRAFKSALQELKAFYGSLANFILVHSDVFSRSEQTDESYDDDDVQKYTFWISLSEDDQS